MGSRLTKDLIELTQLGVILPFPIWQNLEAKATERGDIKRLVVEALEEGVRKGGPKVVKEEKGEVSEMGIKNFSVYVEHDLYDAVRLLAIKHNTSISAIVRRILTERFK